MMVKAIMDLAEVAAAEVQVGIMVDSTDAPKIAIVARMITGTIMVKTIQTTKRTITALITQVVERAKVPNIKEVGTPFPSVSDMGDPWRIEC